jgi:thymidylate kinase
LRKAQAGGALRIAIVGPCGSGKTTLALELQARGLEARQIVQEHSFVPEMWQIITGPDLLIYLDASHDVCNRRKNLGWTPEEHAEQLRRLEHARQHSDLYILTDSLSPEEVLDLVWRHLSERRRTPPDGSTATQEPAPAME